MASNNPSVDNKLEGEEDQDVPRDMTGSPPDIGGEHDKHSLNYSMLSSGSSSFEVLSMSMTKSDENASSYFDDPRHPILNQDGMEDEDVGKVKETNAGVDNGTEQQLEEPLKGNGEKDLEAKNTFRAKSGSFEESTDVDGKSKLLDPMLTKQTDEGAEQVKDTDEEGQKNRTVDGTERLKDSLIEETDHSLSESLVILGHSFMDRSISSDPFPGNKEEHNKVDTQEHKEASDDSTKETSDEADISSHEPKSVAMNAAFGESLVVLREGDVFGSISSEISNRNNQEGVEGHAVSESETVDEAKERPSVDNTVEKDDSLGESLVVLSSGDFDHSLSAEVNQQPITDQMIGHLVQSSHACDEGHTGAIHKTASNGMKFGEAAKTKDEDDESGTQSKSSDETECLGQDGKQYAYEGIEQDTGLNNTLTLALAKSSPQRPDREDEIDQDVSTDTKDPSQTGGGGPQIPSNMDIETSDANDTEKKDFDDILKRDLDDTERRDVDNIGKKHLDDREKGDPDGIEKKDLDDRGKRDPDDSENVDPDGIEKKDLDDRRKRDIDTTFTPNDSMVVPSEHTGDVAISEASSFDNQNDRTNSGFSKNQFQTSELEQNQENVDGHSKYDSSLSESLVVIEKHEFGDTLTDSASAAYQLGNKQGKDEGQETDIRNDTGYRIDGHKAPVGLTPRVIESIVESMPSHLTGTLDQQTTGSNHHEDTDGMEFPTKDRSNSLGGSCISTDSFAVLSDSESCFDNSETELHRLQASMTFTGRDVPVIDPFIGNEEVLDEKHLSHKNDTNGVVTNTVESSPNHVEKETFAGKPENASRRVDLHIPGKNIETENVESANADDKSTGNTSELEAKFDDEESTRAMLNSRTDMYGERIRDSPYPSLSFGSSLHSFVMVSENGGSLRSSSIEDGKQISEDRYLDDTDHTAAIQTDGAMTKNNDQMKPSESWNKTEDKELVKRDHDSDIHRTSSLQTGHDKAATDQQDQNEIMICPLPNEDEDDTDAYTAIKTEEPQYVRKDEIGDSANPIEEEVPAEAQDVDEDQTNLKNERFENQYQTKDEADAHTQSSNSDNKESLNVDFPSLDSFNSMPISNGTQKETTEVHTNVYERDISENDNRNQKEDTPSKYIPENQSDSNHCSDENSFDDEWIDDTKPKENDKLDQDAYCVELENTEPPDKDRFSSNKDSVSSSNSEFLEKDRKSTDQLEEEFIQRNSNFEDPIESVGLPDSSDDDSVPDQPQSVEHSEQPREQNEEEDSTLTLEKPVQGPSQEDMADQREPSPGEIASGSATVLDWYHQCVTIYVQREWSMYEDNKSKVRRDQQAIIKNWIDVEKVKFLFANFHLTTLLKVRLPEGTSVEFDNEKTHMYITYNGKPFVCDEAYLSWWKETIQSVFQTVDGISAYLCKLDNINKESTIEVLKTLTFPNVRVYPTYMPETILVLGSANIGSTLHMVHNQDGRHHIVSTRCMKEVGVVQIPSSWRSWCRYLAEETQSKFEESGIIDILANEDNGCSFLVVDICHRADLQKDQRYVQQVLQQISAQEMVPLEEVEYNLLSCTETLNYINSHKLVDIACHWFVSIHENTPELLVFAHNQESAKKFVTLIKSSVKTIEINVQKPKYKRKLDILADQFRGKLCWSSDPAKQKVHVCITEDILDQVDETIQLLGGRKSETTNKKTETRNVILQNKKNILFFNKFVKDDVMQIENDLQVDVSFQNVSSGQIVIKISGESMENVQAAQSEIQRVVDDIRTFQHPNVEINIPQSQINKVQDIELVNRCVIATCNVDTEEMDDEQLAFVNLSERRTGTPTKWWTFGQARLGFVTGPVRHVEADATVKLQPNSQQTKGANKETSIEVPLPDEGKSKSYLSESIVAVFKRLSETKVRSVAVDLHHCCGWPFNKFLKVMLQTLRELWGPSVSGCGAMDIIVSVQTDEEFNEASNIIGSSGFPIMKELDSPQIIVIKGDITKEKTDVIVNTASKDLDLSHGAVSKALSSRAGKGIQKECKKSYRRGIRYGGLAITDGYDLQCRKVFHGAFDHWSKSYQTERKQTVGNFVTNCLVKANDLGMSSISFPAIGTGVLGYPSAVVAKEMLGKIRHFMDSKPACLRKVNVVIYPSDTDTFNDFAAENSNADAGSSVDPEQGRHTTSTRKQYKKFGRKVYFEVTCRAADQMILMGKIDAILREGLPDFGPDQSNTNENLESESSQKLGTSFTRTDPKNEAVEEVADDLIATLKEKTSSSSHGCCIVIKSIKHGTEVRGWLTRDVRIIPVGVAWPYRNNVCKALVTCSSIIDAEMVHKKQDANFQVSKLEKQALFDVRASLDPQFIPYKHQIVENSGVTVDDSDTGGCQLVGNLPQIEAANEYIVSKLQETTNKTDVCCVDGITADVYRAFQFFLLKDPRYSRYHDYMNGMKYSEVDKAIHLVGKDEFCLDFKEALTQMKTDIVCDQIDISQNTNAERMATLLSALLESQHDVYICTPQDETVKTIYIIGLDRSTVQAMKYQILESLGMTRSRRNRRFDCGLFSQSPKQELPKPILPPPPHARSYDLGSDMEVLAYQGNILYLKVDGIVNAANERLDHGGGVAFAISEAANIQRESTEYVRAHGKVRVGTSCHTSSGDLKHYKYIIHTVGPRWDRRNQSECERQLQEAILSCILEADDLEMESVAIPAISAGIFAMPPDLCVQQYYMGLTKAWSLLQLRPKRFLKQIHFVDKDVQILQVIQTKFDSVKLGSKSYQQIQSEWQISKGQMPSSSSGRIARPDHNTYGATSSFDTASPDPSTRGVTFSFGTASPDHTAHGASPLYPYKEFTNRNGIDRTTFRLTPVTKVHVYTCDILATRVDAVVCGQDQDLNSNSKIASRIKNGELSWKSYEQQIRKIKNQKKNRKSGDTFCIAINGFDASTLIIVVCPSVMHHEMSKSCKEEIRTCTQNVLHKANTMKLRSIALPVIGSGNDVRQAGDVAKVIMEAILKFAYSPGNKDLREIHFVNHDAKVTQVILDMFDTHVTSENARLRQENTPIVYPLVYPKEQPIVYPGKACRQDHTPRQQPKYWSFRGKNREERHRHSDGMNLSDRKHANEQEQLEFENFMGFNTTRQTTDLPARRQSPLKEDYTPEENGPVEIPRVYEDCVICMDSVTSDNVKTLPKCQHSFHPECIDACFQHKPVCPTCGAIHGVITGNQPRDGRMEINIKNGPLPGFDGDNKHFYIRYSFPDGIQENDHPNPGVPYRGTTRPAYLPCNPEGRKVLDMLQVAFKRRLTFTIGHSRTTGEENVVTWNDIHHKTNKQGGQQQFGYPDPGYLSRVTKELAAKGVTEADI
ncbi:uncharacterized protein [Argopecten irradians]|uniref:uncharacterized protein isoform X3 n=1 Tax=Argopecten irradians TaxID=31199 RepID=UPI0037161CBD